MGWLTKVTNTYDHRCGLQQPGQGNFIDRYISLDKWTGGRDHRRAMDCLQKDFLNYWLWITAE